MKKLLSTSIIALSLAAVSAGAMACPKGTSLQGGTGPHHKGGKCVATKSGSTAKTEKKMSHDSMSNMSMPKKS
ncbi:hypothetical protein [Acinetobacter pollinis]|uniref:Lipoprotein n=1 Tax=Acinetobacter pollinis TaxID=2605270 RepID=A0ABU6DUK7_9GAMM|nr:hypothetical protein [Acinetobacter pollinis]MBF7694071.1 hypothetical protein [Acinetobacter pollinis]MBF7698897.1 hypothetical protein [Acinetobacter pollinis]MBF7700465.1 hypothetical protein [Acinetobacter pollinis]MEB5477415.1 hypothetical protein [Acinetobacter pollinis]